MKCKDIFNRVKEYILPILKWSLLSALMGVVGGFLGAMFHYTLQLVTGVREAHNWLIFLLPIGGLLIVCIYGALRLRSNKGTDEMIDCTLNGKAVSPLIAPAIFLATAITHLLGGSAGREGAALQLGGSVASSLGKIFRLKKEETAVMIVCGMSAVFAGLFGTPLTACLFTLEFESVGTMFSPALLLCFVSALLASRISAVLGVHSVTAFSEKTFTFNFENTASVILLAVLIALLGMAMCYVFHTADHLAKRWMKNPYLRVTVGAMVIIALTVLVGDQRFNGAGMEMALQAIDGTADWYSFTLKILFTAITLAAGFKGGEIVPTFCIGATFGCVAGGLLGLDPSLAAMLGLVGLFCSVTNSPLASIVLSVEMFGANNLYVFVLVCVIAFALSGNWGLYKSQVMEFSKCSMKRIK